MAQLQHGNLQGWRLDPLLLFGQLLTAGTATAFAVESLRLRDIISEEVGISPRHGFFITPCLDYCSTLFLTFYNDIEFAKLLEDWYKR